MLNSREQEDQVQLSMNPNFVAYANPKFPHTLAELKYVPPAPSSVDQAGPLKHSRTHKRFLEKPSTVLGIFANVTLWDKIFVISCIIAVSLDPLFFYIPFIDEDKKCLGKDKTLRNVALILRTLTDIIFVVNIAYQIREQILSKKTEVDPDDEEKGEKEEKLEKSNGLEDFEKGECTQFFEEIAGMCRKAKWIVAPWLTLPIFIDIISVVPIPQVLLVYAFFEMRGPGYLDYRKILSAFLLAQYVPRISRIFLAAREYTRTTKIWVKGAFNFFLYILASHVLGAFWYFFAIQRETSCWHRACVAAENCSMAAFYCEDKKTHSFESYQVLNGSCPLIENSDKFDFGIFLETLQDGKNGNIDFLQKFFYTFWWGLRNISNFGTNLGNTSSYVWENFFAIFISITGLLLFLYLIGNVQTLMQFETTKWEEIRRKIKLKELDLQLWMTKNKIPDNLKKRIIKNIRKKLEDDKDANLENLFNVLPWDTRRDLKRYLCTEILKHVPMLKGLSPTVLKMICDYLKPVMYEENTDIFTEGTLLQSMLFIMNGTVLIYSSAGDSSQASGSGRDKMAAIGSTVRTSLSMTASTLEDGGSYGVDQLLSWVSEPNLNRSISNFPVSSENVRSHTKVEGFILMANDLRKVATKCKLPWKIALVDASPQQKQEAASSTIAAAVRRFRNTLPKKSSTAVGAHDQNSPINNV